MKSVWHYSFHSIVYYLAWGGCLFLAAKGYAWLSTGYVIGLTALEYGWQRYLRKDTHHLIQFVFVMTLAGFFSDSILTHIGFIDFAANPFAPYTSSPWMIALWLNFAVFLFSTCRYFFDKYLLTSILAFFGFSVAYLLGAKLGAANLTYGNTSCMIVGLIWMIMLPLLFLCYEKYQQLISRKKI